jgi:putative FmdB family regulatory protein
MPLYEFSCSTCGQTFEKNIPLNASQAELRCPSGHRRVRRVYSALPVMYKGSGFYVTDHHPASPSNVSKS